MYNTTFQMFHFFIRTKKSTREQEYEHKVKSELEDDSSTIARNVIAHDRKSRMKVEEEWRVMMVVKSKISWVFVRYFLLSFLCVLCLNRKNSVSEVIVSE